MSAEEFADLIEQGDLEAVSTMLKQNPELVSAPTSLGNLPLHLAAWQKQLAILVALLDYGPDVNARGDLQRTPLHFAVHEGDASSVPIVKELLARGADPSLKDAMGHTVEDWAKIEVIDALPEVLALLRQAQKP